MSERVIDVIVGAGSGMGAAVAHTLKGDRPLLLVDLTIESAAATASELGSSHKVGPSRNIDCLACDITDSEGLKALADKVPELGTLVITAGLSPTMGTGERVFDVNLTGMASVLDALDSAVGQDSVAVCFASIAGHSVELPPELSEALANPLTSGYMDILRAAEGIDPSDSLTAYGLSKFGVIRLVQRLAPSWARRGARIMSVSPGIIDTPMGNQELAEQEMMAAMIEAVGRMGTAAEVAKVVAFLTSPDASFMSGCDILVDGGFMAMAPELMSMAEDG